jgi:hypothetical protein
VDSTGVAPSGLAIFGFRQGANLVSEASVPAAPLVNRALVYVESIGVVSTGIAITNPGTEDVVVQFSFHDSNKGFYFPTDQGLLTIPAGGQLARFISDLPYGLTGNRIGTVEFVTSAPVGIIAIRGYTNQRSEFLLTTVPVISLPTPDSTEPTFLAHFACEYEPRHRDRHSQLQGPGGRRHAGYNWKLQRHFIPLFNSRAQLDDAEGHGIGTRSENRIDRDHD